MAEHFIYLQTESIINKIRNDMTVVFHFVTNASWQLPRGLRIYYRCPLVHCSILSFVLFRKSVDLKKSVESLGNQLTLSMFSRNMLNGRV